MVINAVRGSNLAPTAHCLCIADAQRLASTLLWSCGAVTDGAVCTWTSCPETLSLLQRMLDLQARSGNWRWSKRDWMHRYPPELTAPPPYPADAAAEPRVRYMRALEALAANECFYAIFRAAQMHAMQGMWLEDARWFSRDDVRDMLAGTHPEAAMPPSIAIARRLAELWVERKI